MDTIDNFTKQRLENALNDTLNYVNDYLTNIDLKNTNLSIKEIYYQFMSLLSFNKYLKYIDVELIRRYKTTINRFPRYFQKYCNTFSNHITDIIKQCEDNSKTLEEMSKEELIDLIRSKQ